MLQESFSKKVTLFYCLHFQNVIQACEQQVGSQPHLPWVLDNTDLEFYQNMAQVTKQQKRHNAENGTGFLFFWNSNFQMKSSPWMV